MRLEQVQCIPEDVGMGCFQFPFQECAHGIVNGIPETEQQVCSFPDFWYVVKYLQAAKFVVKLVNRKEKTLNRIQTR